IVVNSPLAVADTDRRRSLTRLNNGRIFRHDGPPTRSSALGSILSVFTFASRSYAPCIMRGSSPRQATALPVKCQTRPPMSPQGETRGEPPFDSAAAQKYVVARCSYSAAFPFVHDEVSLSVNPASPSLVSNGGWPWYRHPRRCRVPYQADFLRGKAVCLVDQVVEAVFQLLRLGRQQSGWLDRVGILISKAASSLPCCAFRQENHQAIGEFSTARLQ